MVGEVPKPFRLGVPPGSAAPLRSSGLELLGSGFGSASLDQIRESLADFFQAAAKQPFHFQTKYVPLRQVESLWNTHEESTRLVFHP